MTDVTISAFDKARTGLWTSLQKHLTAVYGAEKTFLTATAFVEAFPFTLHSATDEQQADYQSARSGLRDLYTDETAQLDTLVKAIRTKGYSEDEKKQLYLLILGYMDIAASAFALLRTHVAAKQPEDEELATTDAKFERVQKFARLNVKGIAGLLA
ncbi:hypothetical protein SAMN06265337_2671 [Hymenobacter gelipurpurascens]|uniref:Uncharacterized protein n=1 Tax=Hymenobacter gelipurpurascens TaxID=89968 RepID=A0A212UAF8_9BACT|nr:hypothetical protein [Hymenobacter gelipurpurascens]SNC75034.1 hypothetical protein SAMN06265337_2671 [Hymenobacter gelipurpurascens]